MNEESRLELPPEIEKFRAKIEATIKPYIDIQATPNDNTTLWQSKFGGLPYFPQRVEYPRSPNGDYLYLLAQINFAEVPPLENFPTQGILQFYISDAMFYGCDFENPTQQLGFRVLYFPKIERDRKRLIQNFDFLPEPEFCPIERTLSLEFALKTAPITSRNYQFNDICKNDFSEELKEQYDKFRCLLSGHQLGGYPDFTQTDPRTELPKAEESYILLLQIDSEEFIMWGDSGIGNFFIKESALKRLDFSDVFYNWDCG